MTCICCDSYLVLWDELKLYHCNSCGYSGELQKTDNPYLNNRVFSDRFLELEKSGTSKELSSMRIKMIQKSGVSTGNLFDIGCSIGSLIQEANANGFKASGVDCSAPSVEIAKSRGLDVSLSEFESMNGSLPKSDCYTMYDVLEHLEDPLECLKKLRSLISPDGILVISVPNANVDRHEFSSYRHYKPGEHKHYFTMDSIIQILSKCSFNAFNYNFDESIIRFNPKKPNDNILTVISRPF